MTEESQIITLTLNANGIFAPLNKILSECTDSILFGLQTMEIVGEIPPNLEIDGGFLRMQIGEAKENIDVRKEKYKLWLIKKGFEDLVKGIEAALREAYFYVSFFSKATALKTGQDFNEAYETVRKKALKMHIPEMFDVIEPHLTKPLAYKEQILSINKARNCLVHRHGIVLEKDINDEIAKTLKLEWVKFKIFYEKGEEEVEVQSGTIVEGGNTIKMRRENNSTIFQLGELITLNYSQFNEFIVTCYHFGIDLVDVLPKELSRP